MNVLIVEDEPLAAERLESLLQDYDSSIRILSVIDTVDEAAPFIDKHREDLDLVFLDIQLADGKSFEIFNKISYNKPVVFTTAYDEYAINAFKLNSIDYLLKPIKYEQLEAALNKYHELNKNSTSENPTLDAEFIKELLGSAKAFKKRFLVKYGSKIMFKNTTEAAVFSAEDKICHLHSYEAGRKYVIDHTLEELDTQLLNPEQFFRINRQYILNLDAIKELNTKDQKLEIQLNFPFKEKLQVSRSKVSDFKSWIDR
ncbi:LytR/AlgR family response regulator transcription factor [Fulvivirga lutea]|uniref:Response regulator transcription factor n=1 Tax=Fulvivirga lutea TaxID=2810512 RepID=A0A974WIY2_9BACT|nr:LytTR family DNA-binding domain-containing protein [Fulvivirga lutea]QSE97982.1 response regulator transcription factor [Fulvivirga lutea]